MKALASLRRGLRRPAGRTPPPPVSPISPVLALLAPLALAPILPTSGLAAQEDPAGIASTCGEAGSSAHSACLQAALGLEAARGAVGLAAAGGSDLPATNSTVGKRIGAAPRWALTLRAGLTRAPFPGGGAGGGPGDDPGLLTDETTTALSLRGDLAFGLFDGFSIAPTVGGILSLDLLGEAGLVALSGDDGFDDDVTGWGVGARLGVVRESFGVPGITVTLTRRWLGDSSFTTGSPGADRSGDFETTVTSLRGVVGKDFFALGILAGVGWDRYEGDASLTAALPGEAPALSVDADDLTSERVLVFGSLSYNFLILQLSAEGGWAEGFDSPAPSGSFDPSDGSLFGAVAFRLLL